MKNIFLRLTIISIFFSTFFSCGTKCRIDYNFEIPVTTSPTQGPVYVGDTIFISLEYDLENILDLSENKNVEIRDNIDTDAERSFVISSLSDTILATNGISNFELINISGNTSRSGGSYYFTFEKINNNIKQVKFALISDKPGKYLIGFSATELDRFDRDLTQSKCKDYFDITFTTNNNLYNYFELYEGSYSQVSLDIKFEDFQSGNFVFEVLD